MPAHTRAQAEAQKGQEGVHPEPKLNQKRGKKRKADSAEPSSPNQDHRKRQRPSSHPSPGEKETSGGEANTTGSPPKKFDPVSFWVKEGFWPELKDWDEESSESSGDDTPARKESDLYPPISSSKESESKIRSDQKLREAKKAPYKSEHFPLLLKTKGSSYLKDSPLGITDESKTLCATLLDSEQPVPKPSLFDDDIFESVCVNIENKNEARVLRDISQLIVPAAEILALRDDRLRGIIQESVNEGWDSSIPLTGSRPQPDYSVGFQREAFTTDQLAKLSPHVGKFGNGFSSFFMATASIYLPFLTCEVNGGADGLDIADRQNAHSMTLAVRGVVELFRLVGREKELNRELLAFSVSHDNTSVRIYGHYPVIDSEGKGIKYYRRTIGKFDLTWRKGQDKWTGYRFTKNVYDLWMPTHFKRICSVIDQLPAEMDFGYVSP